MKKIFALLLVVFLSFSASFALSPAEQKANELKVIVKMILDQSKNIEKDTTMIKNLFAGCEKTCKDAVVRDAIKIINTTFEQDFGIKKEEQKSDFLTYTLLEVVDGDTIKVLDENKKEYSVRMIGLDTPESYPTRYGYIECYGKEASDHLKYLLKDAKEVQFEVDPTQTTTDKYGRLLGYVFFQGKNLNKQMIEDGYGWEYTYNLPYKYQSAFKQAQKTASENNLGLWSASACKGERKAITEKEEKIPELGSSQDYPSTESYSSYKIYHTGPKGGCYYWSGNSKVYVDKSYCGRSSTSATSSYSHSSYSSGRTCYTGPRGGRYYYNSKGKKVYGCN